VETVLLPFVSSGKDGLRAILNLRLVCKTTKSWVDCLPSSQARRVFSKACIKFNFSYYRTFHRFINYEPPFGITSLCLIFEEISEGEGKFFANDKMLEPRLEAWSSRLEYLDIQILDSKINLKALCPLLKNAGKLLKEIHFTVLSMQDFVNLRWFTPQITPAAKLTINLADGNPDDSEAVIFYSSNSRKGILYTKKVLVSLLSQKSQLRLHVKQLSIIYSLKIMLVNESPSCEDFFSLINTFECEDRENEVGPALKDHFQSLETLVYGNVNAITFPPSLQSFKLMKGFPPKTLPGSLKSLHLEDWTCSLNAFLNSMAYLENDCLNLQTLSMNWQLDQSTNNKHEIMQERQNHGYGFCSKNSQLFSA